MGNVISFPPRRKRRRVAALPLFPAEVKPFSLANDRKVVLAIAQEMFGKANIDEAEGVLVSHLELEVFRLARAGVDDRHIEWVCHEFAVAVWQHLLPPGTEVFA